MSPQSTLGKTWAVFERDLVQADLAGAKMILFPEFSFFWPKNRNQTLESAKNSSQMIAKVTALLSKCQNVSLVLYNFCETVNQSLYNTNFVIMKNASIVKYHKSHPWFTKIFDKPSSPDLMTVNFENTTFGLFMCYDIVFKSPSVILREKGIKSFLYNAAIPIVGADVFRIWSLKNDAILFASGGESQVGMFHSGHRDRTAFQNIFLANSRV